MLLVLLLLKSLPVAVTVAGTVVDAAAIGAIRAVGEGVVAVCCPGLDDAIAWNSR